MKVSVDNIVAILIAMDTPSMSGNVWYYDEANEKYIVFDDIMVENPITQNDAVSIREFYPNPITAGTFDTLTIEGDNFGDNAVAVSFTGADLNEDITSITTTDAELVFWSDTLIKAIVPSNATFGSAGTGIITVHTFLSGDIQSDTSLNVLYSVLNNKVENPVTSILEPFRIELIDADGQGGYTFHLDTFLNAQTNCSTCTEMAMCKWNKETGITWELGSATTTTTSNGNDGESVIFYNPNQTDTSFLQRTFIRGHVDNCFNDSIGILYVDNIDIEVNGYYDWQFDCFSETLEDTVFDYLSVVIHEFGHAHSLDHATPETKAMKPGTFAGELDRDIFTEDIDGGINVLESSQYQIRGECPDTIKRQVMAACLVDNVSEEKGNLNNLVIYPNPFQSNISVSFYLKRHGDIEINLMDLFGRSIIQKRLDNLWAGQHVETFINDEVSKLAQGIYVLQMSFEGVNISRTIVKI